MRVIREGLIFLLVAVLLFPVLSFADAQVTVSWTYGADYTNVTGFRIYASTTSGQYTEEDLVATVDYATGEAEYSTGTTLKTTPGQETTFYFVGTAYNDQTESGYSNEASFTALGRLMDFQVTVPLAADGGQ